MFRRKEAESRIEVEILTRPGCHLCDEMKGVFLRASKGLDVALSETDVSKDPELERRYGNDVPVLFVNGSKAFKHRASERELRRRLLSEP
jgi:glutaredoxin